MSISLIVPVLSGILTGFLINYVADVLPDSLRLGIPQCQNQACRTPYPCRDYLLFYRCRICAQPRRLRAFLVLPLAVSAALYVWYSPPARLGFALGLLMLVYLFLIGVIDIEHRLVLRPLSIIGFLLAALAGFLLHGWQKTAVGAVFGFSTMLFFYLLGTWVTRWIAKEYRQNPGETEEALGSGDVTLATILGLLLGWPLIWVGLLLGALILGFAMLPIAFGLFFRRHSNPRVLMYIPLGWSFILGAVILVYLPAWIAALLPR